MKIWLRGLRSSDDGMSMHRNPLKMGLILAACLGMSRLSISLSHGGSVHWSIQLEARVRANPNADSYAELGAWFVQNQSTDCAVQAFQTGLKLDPSSARLNYSIGLNLYKAGAWKRLLRRFSNMPGFVPRN